MTSQRVISLTLAITLAVFLINMDQTTAQRNLLLLVVVSL